MRLKGIEIWDLEGRFMFFDFHILILLQRSIGLKIKAEPSDRRRRSLSYFEEEARAPTKRIRPEAMLGVKLS